MPLANLAVLYCPLCDTNVSLSITNLYQSILDCALWTIVSVAVLCGVTSTFKESTMANEKPIFDYKDETHSEKLARKSKESPFMVVGLAGLAAAVGYGAYAYKRRGAMSTSVFLMQFRVIAQGTTVGALTLGMMYTLYKNHFAKKPEAIATGVIGNN